MQFLFVLRSNLDQASECFACSRFQAIASHCLGVFAKVNRIARYFMDLYGTLLYCDSMQFSILNYTLAIPGSGILQSARSMVRVVMNSGFQHVDSGRSRHQQTILLVMFRRSETHIISHKSWRKVCRPDFDV